MEGIEVSFKIGFLSVLLLSAAAVVITITAAAAVVDVVSAPASIEAVEGE